MTIEDLKTAITASNEATAQLQGKLDKALADAAQAAKDEAEADQARTELAQADEVRKTAAAKLAALPDEKKL